MNYLRWQCPHCETTLVTSEKKLGEQWTFSRCFNCGGFAFVRWSGIKLIKVDSNPLEDSEKILIPSSEIEFSQPKAILKEASPKPTTKASTTTIPKPKVEPEPKPNLQEAPKPDPSNEIHLAASETEESLRESFLSGKSLLDTPFDEETENTPKESLLRSWKNQSWSNKAITVATAISGILAIISGVYLYQQGNELMGDSNDGVAQATTDSLSTENKDVIKTSALSPTRPTKDSNPESPQLIVTIRPPHVNLRSGPGLQFKAPASVKRGTQLKVVSWQDRWFQVEFSNKNRPPHVAKDQALWIRNDMVSKSL